MRPEVRPDDAFGQFLLDNAYMDKRMRYPAPRKLICCIPRCKSRYKREVALFIMPEDTEVRRKWEDFLLIMINSIEKCVNYAVCEFHFYTSDVITGKEGKTLRKGAFPLIFAQIVSFVEHQRILDHVDDQGKLKNSL